MRIPKAPLCTQCGKRHTDHPTGLCCRCRYIPKAKPCKVCGTRKTGDSSGICSQCRSCSCRGLEGAIETQRRILRVLELRQGNMTFDSISKEVGMSRTRAFEAYRNALRLPTWAMPTD